MYGYRREALKCVYPTFIVYNRLYIQLAQHLIINSGYKLFLRDVVSLKSPAGVSQVRKGGRTFQN